MRIKRIKLTMEDVGRILEVERIYTKYMSATDTAGNMARMIYEAKYSGDCHPSSGGIFLKWLENTLELGDIYKILKRLK